MRILLLLFLIINLCVLGQEGRLEGRVTNQSGDPLIGASVIFRGDITRGASTDIEGNYQLNLPVGHHQLICRFTNMRTDTFTVEIKPNEFSSHDIVLKSYDEV